MRAIVDASEVVQVYAGARDSGLELPIWRLAAFQRVDVPPGGSISVRLTVPFERLAVRVNGAWAIEPGAYEIAAGRYARDPQAAIVRVELPGR